MSLPALSLNRLAGAEPQTVFPPVAQPIERLLLELLQRAYDGQMRVVPSGGLTKASMLQLAKRRDPKEQLQGIVREDQWPALHWVRVLASGAGLLRVGPDATLHPTREALNWLQLDAGGRAGKLFAGWLAADWDELSGLEGMRILPRPTYAIHRAKQAIQHVLAQLPDHTWVEVQPFVAEVQRTVPGFFRQDVRSTYWSIRDRFQRPLDGDEHWAAVEGLWLRLVMCVTLRWLGMVDVGAEDRQHPSAIRLTALGSALLKGESLPVAKQAEPIILQPNFEILVPADASLYARFQLRRIADEISNAAVMTYRLTRKSLHDAQARGIGITEITEFLEQQSGRALPQNVLMTMREWAGEYGKVTLRRTVLLEADTRVTLEQIRHDKRLRLPAAIEVGERALSIDEADAAPLAERMRKAGYGLASDLDDGSSSFSDHELAALMVAVEYYCEACQALDLESEVSTRLRRRVQKQISEKAALRARQVSLQAVSMLRKRLRDA